MSFTGSGPDSYTTRLTTTGIAIIVVVSIAFAIIVSSAMSIRQLVFSDVEKSLENLGASSAISRRLISVDHDVELLRGLLPDPTALANKGEKILDTLNEISTMVNQKEPPGFSKKRRALTERYMQSARGLVNDYKKISNLHSAIDEQTSALEQDLNDIDKINSRLISEYVSSGKNSNSLRQVYALLPLCRQYITQTKLLIDTAIFTNKPELINGATVAEADTVHPVMTAPGRIQKLEGTMRTLTSAESIISDHIRGVIAKIPLVTDQIRTLHTVVESMNSHNKAFNNHRKAMIRMLFMIDSGTNATMRGMKGKIHQRLTAIIFTISIFFSIVLLACLIGWYQIRRIGYQMQDAADDAHKAKISLEKTNQKLYQEILERQKAEAALKKSHNELEVRVRDRTKDLYYIIHQLKQEMTERTKLERQLLQAQKMEAIGQLAGGIAHDFNNIISAIVNYAYLINRHPDDHKSVANHVDKIISLSERGTRITTELLALSRKQHFDLQVLDINEIVQHMQHLFSSVIGNGITISAEFASDTPCIFADRTQIEQVMLNLMTNARDAMPSGGQICIRTDSIEIDSQFISNCGFGRPGHYAVLSLSDTGKGIPAEIRDKIFEPFFTTKDIGKGTGLGLATSYGIVRQHNGYIDVKSEPGKGSTFYIYLPAAG